MREASAQHPRPAEHPRALLGSPLCSQAARDPRAGGSRGAPHAQTHSQWQHLSPILAEQGRRWDLPADNRWVTGNTACCWPCSRAVRGVGQQGRHNGEGGTPSSPQGSLLHLPPRVIFFFFQDTSKPTLTSPGLSSAQDLLLPDPQTRAPKIPEHWCCEAPSPSRHSTLGRKDLGILLLPPGMDLPGDDPVRGRQCSVPLDCCSQVGSELCYCSRVNQHPPRARVASGWQEHPPGSSVLPQQLHTGLWHSLSSNSSPEGI